MPRAGLRRTDSGGSTCATTTRPRRTFRHHYGLLTDAYAPKPAFGAYRHLVARLGRSR
jgi:hypothetical protein